jgi:signal transduction histidine kinase
MGPAAPSVKTSPAARLIKVASSQKKLSGLNQILKVVAEELGACGCVLWEAIPGSNLRISPPTGGLFAVGAWFETSAAQVRHYIVADSETRKAILSPGTINDITNTQGMRFKGPEHVRAFSSVAVNLPGTSPAAINIYRDFPGALTEGQKDLLKELAGLIGPVYAALVNRVGFNLVNEVRSELQKAEQGQLGSTTPPPETLVTRTLDSTVAIVQETFNCVQVDVLFEDRFNAPREFVLRSSKGTWPSSLRREKYTSGRGKTGWAIANRKSVRILDLTRINLDRTKKCADRDAIEAAYPEIDLSFPPAEALKQHVRPSTAAEHDPVPPVGFMCSPIISRNRVLGAIRCVAIMQTPSYFDDRQVQFLEIVASFLGDWWDNRLSRIEAAAESKQWNLVEEIVSGLGKPASRNSSSIRSFYEIVLLNIAGLIPNLDTLDVCLVSSDAKDLKCEVFHKVEKSQSNSREAEGLKFSLRGDQPSAGAVAVREKRTYTVQDVEKDPNYVKVFPLTRRMMCVPIRFGDSVIGVLDLRRAIDADFTDTEKKFAELLGQQLGLYQNLSQSLQRAQTESTQRIKAEQSYAEIYRNLQHQIRSPISAAYRIATLLSGTSGSRESSGAVSLASIRSLTRRADRVAHSMSLFATLTQDKPVSLGELTTLTHSPLVARLTESSRDHEIVLPPQRNVRFHVDNDSFDVLTGMIVRVDLKLLDQMIDNLLDNAAKYSYPRTRVRIAGGTQRNGEQFYISVQNQGFRINSNETKRVLEKEYRGEQARLSTGEGYGLGLWIVSAIMKAHRGEVVVIPTTDQDLTDVRLVFPRFTTG